MKARSKSATKKVLTLIPGALFIFGIIFLFVPSVPFIYNVPHRPMIVLSDSMSPKFHAGDIILSNHKSAKTLEEGEVITFIGNQSKQRITHRISDIDTYQGKIAVRTKGDANKTQDPWITLFDPNEDVHTTEVVLPNIGHTALLMQSPWIKIFLLVAITSYCLVWGLKAIWHMPKLSDSD